MNEFERPQCGVHRVDLLFEPLDLGGRNAQCAGAAPAVFGRAQIGTEIEQIVLDMAEHCVCFGIGMEAGDADRGIGFVDGAISGYAEGVLRHARTVAQRGLTAIAATGIDPR